MIIAIQLLNYGHSYLEVFFKEDEVLELDSSGSFPVNSLFKLIGGISSHDYQAVQTFVDFKLSTESYITFGLGSLGHLFAQILKLPSHSLLPSISSLCSVDTEDSLFSLVLFLILYWQV